MSRRKHTISELTRRYENESVSENIIKSTLLKKAKGFVLEEISEEYSKDEDGNSLKLVKRKVTSKEVAPDVNAIKVLIEMSKLNENTYKNMTDEELIKEKDRLIKLLEGGEKEVYD